MSSIISDIFYGSKQNLLDNYLIHRFEKEPSLSHQNLQQKTALYSSALHFIIIIPLSQDHQQRSYGIKVQLGKRIEEVIASVGGAKHTSQILVELNDLESVDLAKYSNIKITISQGKYKDKVFGYIPIQTIKSMMAQHGSQKTIILPVKGKRSFGFSSIKCHIKADFAQNILNSNILGSIDKDNSQISHLQFKSRENDIHEMSGIQQHSQNMQLQDRKYANKRDLQKFNKKSMNESESRIMQKFINYYQNSNENKPKLTNQFIKQILPVSAIFSNIKLNKLHYAQQNIKLSLNTFTFAVGQEIKLSNITQRGLNVDIYVDENKIGTVHLNVLFLTMTDFRGELPIYDQNQQFVGTILVCSPSISMVADYLNCKQNRGKHTQLVKQAETQLDKTTYGHKQFNNLLVLSIKKIVMTNISKQLDNDSLDNINQFKIDLFDFVKMEACGRLQLIVRVNNQTFRFNNISLRYLIDNDQTQVVQLRRKEGFTVTSWQQIQCNNNLLEMELYSNHRLLSYAKNIFAVQTQATHHFAAAKTEFAFSQSAIYCSYIQLKIPQDYFQPNRLSQIMSILKQIVDTQLKLGDLSDETIKYAMNSNKKIAYVEVKKLFNLIQPFFNQFRIFQQTSLATVLQEQPLNNLLITQTNAKLLRQFVLLDIKNSSSIQYQDFLKIVQFFTTQAISEIQQSCDKLTKNCISDGEGRVLYPLFVAGFYLHNQPTISQQQILPAQNNHSGSEMRIAQDKPKHQVQKEVVVISEQRYFIQSIEFRNLHLLNLGKIPNAMLSIAKKTHYSNANPEFIIEKEINLREPIKIYHKNIANNNMQLLTEMVPIKRRSLYELDISGKVTAKIVWGN